MSHCLDVRKNIKSHRRPPDRHLEPLSRASLLPIRGYLTSFPTSIATVQLGPSHRSSIPEAGLPAYVPILGARDRIGASHPAQRLNQVRIPRFPPLRLLAQPPRNFRIDCRF